MKRPGESMNTNLPLSQASTNVVFLPRASGCAHKEKHYQFKNNKAKRIATLSPQAELLNHYYSSIFLRKWWKTYPNSARSTSARHVGATLLNSGYVDSILPPFLKRSWSWWHSLAESTLACQIFAFSTKTMVPTDTHLALTGPIHNKGNPKNDNNFISVGLQKDPEKGCLFDSHAQTKSERHCICTT